jgi:hypothetical protein
MLDNNYLKDFATIKPMAYDDTLNPNRYPQAPDRTAIKSSLLNFFIIKKSLP